VPRNLRSILALLVLLAPACASTVVDVKDRTVQDALDTLVWRPATAPELVGHWRVRSLAGPAAAVLMDLAYWIDAGGHFSGAALFAGPPPTYQVLSGTWRVTEDGRVQLGEESEPALAEVGGASGPGGFLRLSGAEGRLVLERAEIR
jgi:hypothetical protein